MRRAGRQAGRWRGVTLIEVLVVVAVVGALVGIAVPALVGARRAADASACLANLRTIGQAFGLYAQDHADEWPTYEFQRDPDGVIRREILTEWWFAIPIPRDQVGTRIFVLPADQVQIWANPLRTYVTDEAEDSPFNAEQVVSCLTVYRELTRADRGQAAPSFLSRVSYLQSPAFFTTPSAWAAGSRVDLNRDYAPTRVSDVAFPANKALLIERFSHHSRRRDAITDGASALRFNALAADGHAEPRRGDQARPAVAVEGRRAGGLPCVWCRKAVPYLTTAGGLAGADW